MESELVIALVLLSVGLLVALLRPYIKQNQPKKATNDTFGEYQEMMSTALKDSKAQIRSLQGKVNRLTGMQSEEEESDDNTDDVLIHQLAKRFNIPEVILNTPDVKAGIKRILKDKTIRTALPILANATTAQPDPVQAYINQTGNYV